MARYLILFVLLGVAVEVCGQEVPSDTELEILIGQLKTIQNESHKQGASYAKYLNQVATETEGKIPRELEVFWTSGGVNHESMIGNYTRELLSLLKVFQAMQGESSEKDKAGWNIIRQVFAMTVIEFRVQSRFFLKNIKAAPPELRASYRDTLERFKQLHKIAEKYGGTRRMHISDILEMTKGVRPENSEN